MDHLDELSIETLQRALADTDDPTVVQRLLAAIAYKHGVTQTELAKWHGVQRRTIYNWLTRLEEEPLEQALSDDHRPGRPRKLTESQRERLERTVHEPPTDAGYDAPAWTPTLLQTFIRETFDTDYSIPSCRRLLAESGLEYRRSRRPAADVRSDDPEDVSDDREKSDGRWIPR